MKARTILALMFVVALTTTSCAFFSPEKSSYEPHDRISKVLINETISIPPGKTRVFFQNGKVVSQFNHYQPNCNIEVRLRDDVNIQLIEPSEYQVTSIRTSYEQVVDIRSWQTIKLAQANLSQSPLLYSFLLNEGSDIYRGYHFYLSGKDQNVYRLSCRGVYAPPYEADLPKSKEISQSLGTLISYY